MENENNQLIQQDANQFDGQTQTLESSDISNDEKRYVTIDELEKILDQKLNKTMDKQFQAFQSMMDKNNRRVKEAVMEQLKLLKDAGINPTREQEMAIREQIIERVQQQQLPDEPARGQVITEEQVNADVQSIYNKYGIYLEENDEEIKLINSNAPTYSEFLATVVEAVLAKQERLREKKSLNRVAAMTGTSGGTAVDDAPSEELFAKAYKK